MGKDTASGPTSRAGSGGRQTRRGPDAREGLNRGVMEGEPAASFQPQLRLPPSRTGNCGGVRGGNDLSGQDSQARRKEAQEAGRRSRAVPGATRGFSGAHASAGRKRPAHYVSGAEPKGLFRPRALRGVLLAG